jgi:UDP-N-acetylmuramyl tripeptide synthase
MTDTPIAIPIEVKLSFNPQSRTGLTDQLTWRYVPETAAAGGVFVLVWMDAPNLAPSHRPLWRHLTDARRELSALATAAAAKSGTDIRLVVINVSRR